MRRPVLAALLALALLVPAATTTAATSCVPVESHSWWIQKGEPAPGRHIHVSTCFPRHAVLGGSLHLDIAIALHNQPGTVTLVRVQAWPQLDPAWQKTVSLSCPTANCDFVVPADINLGSATGWSEFRVTANIKSNVFGQRQYQTTRWPACLRTCSGGYGTHRTGAGGWYLGSYQNAYIDDASMDAIQRGPINGLTFRAKGDRSRVTVAVDAHSHDHDPGIVLGTTTSHDWKSYTIPKGLASGPHKLFIRTEQDFSTGTSAGQFVVGFTVP